MKNLKHAARPQMKSQQGMTMISMAIILVMIGFIALIALRLFPVYLESFKVNSHLETLAATSTTRDMSNREIVQALQKRFSIDDISNVKAENIFVERSKDGDMSIAIEYEVRTPGIGNVDMVVSFLKEVAVN